jgi:tight adherence protein C
MMPVALVVAGSTFLAVALFIVSLTRIFAGTDPLRGRLDDLGPGGGGQPLGARTRHLAQPLLQLFAGSASGRRDQGIRRTLRHAGYRQESAAVVFHAVRLAVGLLGLALGLLVLTLMRPPFVTGLVMICLWGFGVFALPAAYVRLRATERMRTITEGLPGALDLLVICLEAGLGLDAAIVRVATELRRGNPVLGGELLTMSREVQAGIPRRDALRQLGERTGVSELATLATILAQSDRLGTSVAQALRTQAETMRTRRRQRAEEQAAKTAVKIVFPLVFCIFPALFVVVLGPALMTVYRMFGQVTG